MYPRESLKRGVNQHLHGINEIENLVTYVTVLCNYIKRYLEKEYVMLKQRNCKLRWPFGDVFFVSSGKR